MSENWKPVDGYEGLYEVSDLGRVRSVERTVTDRNGREMRWKEKVLALPGKMAGNKMTAEVARRIFNLEGHITRKSIAKFFGVTTATVSHILNGKTWSHVTGAGGAVNV